MAWGRGYCTVGAIDFISCPLDFKLECQFWLQDTLHPTLAEYLGWLTRVMVTGFIFVASVGQLSLISKYRSYF